MTVPTVSVVMATYNRCAFLPRVLDALLADPGVTELVVVVDGCRDGSLELLERVRRDDPRVVAHWQQNAGASLAQQRGIELATGDVVLMFDDDQIAGPGLASGHAQHHADRSGLVVVGYVPPPPLEPDATFVQRDYVTAYAEDCRRFEAGAPVLEQLWGGNLSLRREDMLRVGWASNRFPHRYHYDWDFGLRCIEAGLTGVYDGSLTALHEYHRTPAQFRREAREQGRALRLLADLHPGLTDSTRYHHRGRIIGRIQRLARRPRASELIARALVAAAATLHRLHRYGLEALAGNLLWYVEAQRGAIEEHGRLTGGRR